MAVFTSKYAILIIVNLLLLLIAVTGTLVNYNTKRISRRRAILELLFWGAIGVMLVLIEPIYNALLRHHITNSAPMSIFDVVLLTLVILCLLLIKHVNEKVVALSRKISTIHEGIVIAEERRHWDK